MIVKMSKFTLLGVECQREALVNSLMNIGAVEISTADAGECEKLVIRPDVQGEVSDIGNGISEVRTALASLDRYCPEKKGMFPSKREMTSVEISRLLENRSDIWNAVKSITKCEEQIIRLKAEENRISNHHLSLIPWMEYPVALEISGTRRTVIIPGTISQALDIDGLKKNMAEEAPCSEFNVVSQDKDQYYVYVISHRDFEQDCLSFLKTRGFNKASFPGMTGTAAENIEKLKVGLKELSQEKEKAETLIKSYSDSRKDIEALHDSLVMEQERSMANSRILFTKKAFLINGWVPAKLAAKAKKDIESKFTVSIDITEPGEDEETPVLLENRGIAEAGEPISKMYSLPSSREIDPNAVMSPFFVLFFGLMLGDGGYGIIMALAAVLVLRRFKLEDNTRKFMKLIFWCGLSTIFWGFMFGSWFGIEALAQYGIWLNPVEQPELLLSWSLLFGIIHMYAGFGLKAANLIREKKYLDAVLDVGCVLVFYTGVVLVLLPFAPEVNKEAVQPLVQIGQYMMVGGVVLLLATQGRKSKKLLGKIFGGLPSLYNVVSFLSDILSYSRLLALGLATGIIATIINQLSVMFEFPIVIKIVVSALILLIGHAINFAINALGAYVHSSRLQYLEFFGKFFSGGGQAFKPLRANTKYISVKPDADV